MKQQKIILRNDSQKESIIQFIRTLCIIKPIVIIFEEEKKRRSLSQNALMWSWYTEVSKIISDETGNDTEDLHDFFKKKFLQPKVVDIHGEVFLKYSTKGLSTAEMTTYLDRIYHFVVADWGIFLPLPQDRMVR